MSRVPRFQLAKQLDHHIQSPQRNVFMTDQPNNPGPSYDNSGNIVPSSIVGKPEWFFKVMDSRRAQSNKGDSYRGSVVEESVKSKRYQPFFKTTKLPEQHVAAKPEIPFKVVPKELLLDELKVVKKRCEQNDLRKSRFIDKLKVDARHFITKDGRVLDKFEQLQSQWEERSLSLSSKVGRNPNQTLLNRSAQYRKRVEDIETLALVQTDIERLAHRHWYLRLRQYPTTSGHQTAKPIRFHEHKDHSPPRLQVRHIKDEEHERFDDSCHLSDIFNGFNTRIAFNPNKQVEVVVQNETQSQERSSLYSRQFISTFESKMGRLKEQIKNRKVDCDSSLMVEGENVLQKEIRVLLKDNAKQPYLKFDIEQPECEAINESNWNHRELGRTGHQFYPRLLERIE